jgi:hypothetical protein
MKRKKPNTPEVVQIGELQRKNFRLLENDKMFEILSDKLYTDKLYAPIRELIANAYDANVEAGNDPYDFVVGMPTEEDLTFYVRDYGVGMTADEIENLYSVYGMSSKEDTNEQIGCIGLGAKSPFAYTTEFTVDSIKNGTRNVYHCYMQDGYPRLTRMLQCAAGKERNGTKVSYQVRTKDVHPIYEKVAYLLQLWRKRPTVTHLDYAFYHGNPSTLRALWEVADSSLLYDLGQCRIYESHGFAASVICVPVWRGANSLSSSVIVLTGNIPYAVSYASLKYPLTTHAGMSIPNVYKWCFNGAIRAVIDVPIGDLSVTVSRESLEDTEENVKVLRKAIESAYIAHSDVLFKEYKALPEDAYVPRLRKAEVLKESHITLSTEIAEDVAKCKKALDYKPSRKVPYTIYNPRYRRWCTNRYMLGKAEDSDKALKVPDIALLPCFYANTARGISSALKSKLMELHEETANVPPKICVVHDEGLLAFLEKHGTEVVRVTPEKTCSLSARSNAMAYRFIRNNAKKYTHGPNHLNKNSWHPAYFDNVVPGIKHYVELDGWDTVQDPKNMVDLTELTSSLSVEGFFKCLGINAIYGLRKTVAKKAERDPDWVPLEEAVAAWFRNPGNDDELRYRAQVELYTYAYDVIPCCDVYRACKESDELLKEAEAAVKFDSRGDAVHKHIPTNVEYQRVPYYVSAPLKPALIARKKHKYSLVAAFRKSIEGMERKFPLLRLVRNAFERNYNGYKTGSDFGIENGEYVIKDSSWDALPIVPCNPDSASYKEYRAAWKKALTGYVSAVGKTS